MKMVRKYSFMYDVQYWINENVRLISLMTMLKTFLYIIHFIHMMMEKCLQL